MKILYLSPMSPLSTIIPYIRTRLDFMPYSEEHQEELATHHMTLSLPGPEELVMTMNSQLTYPGFYEQCLEKIESCGRFSKPSLNLAIARKIVASSPSLIESIKKGLATPPTDPGFSREMMKLLATWRNLMLVVRATYPETDALAPEALDEFFGEEKQTHKISLSAYLEKSDDIWNTADLLSGHWSMKVDLFRPDVVFLNGWCPVNLPFFVAAAKRLKAVHQNALVFLRHAGGLESANIHYRDWFFKNTDFFDLVDGVILYSDLTDLTCYEIIKSLSSCGEFRGVSNLAYRHHGKIVFSKPQREAVDEYLQETTLSLPPNFSIQAPTEFQSNWLLPTPKVTMANIVATKQACYWNKCHFCDINQQSFVLRDPCLSRRGEEVSQLLLDLRHHGVDFAFVYAAAVPPLILGTLVKNLTGRTNLIPWGYEARFDPILTSDFVKKLHAAGCLGAIFGLETAVDRMNNLMNKYPQDMDVSSIERIIDDFDRNNMMVHVNTIINLPGMSENEFQQHSRWLHTNLDRHKLFHFNTNGFRLKRGSAIARRPLEFGIQIESDRHDPDGYDSIPFSHLPSTPQGLKKDSFIYKECFGFDEIWGLPIYVIHGIYHERLTLSFFDALHGENLLKYFATTRKEEIQGTSMELSDS